MGYTFAEKALARTAGVGHAAAGQIVDVRPDVALSHDNTAAIAKLFRSLGYARVAHPERLAIVLDHAVPAPTAEHALNHKEAREFAAEQGIGHFYDAGRGICHQVVSEEALIAPGQLILGADSHTTHFGWLGAFGAGIGRSEMAAIWATGELWLRVPETIRIDLAGELPPGVTSKDLGLTLLKLLGPEAGIYRALEFGGPGLHTLSVESRMVLPNLMAESGAKNAYLEPDEAVFEWLAQRTGNAETQRRKDAKEALYPDPDADYLQCHYVDLSGLEPVVAAPHSPANAVPLSQVAGVRIDQAFLGSCTNGRLEDLAAAAAVLRGPDGSVRKVARGTRLVVIPASSAVLKEALALGYVETFLAAGAMLGTPGCGPCMGNHLGIPATGETVISSSNRNFRGRMGNPEAAVYLASPAVVAASAVMGRIADPRELLEESGNGKVEASILSEARLSFSRAQSTLAPALPAGGLWLRSGASAGEDADFAMPAAGPSTTPGPLPRLRSGCLLSLPPSPTPPLPHTPTLSFTGRAWKYGDDVNTDVIFPGKYTYTIKDEKEMAAHALEDLDPSFAANVRPGDIVVAGRNFGAGSSREQAVTCLKAAGVRVLIAASFARIFFRNAVNNSMLPVACAEAATAIRPGETVSVDLDRCTVSCAAGRFPFRPLSPSVRRIIEEGGLLEMLRAAATCKQSA